jgi:hypothetical protein
MRFVENTSPEKEKRDERGPFSVSNSCGASDCRGPRYVFMIAGRHAGDGQWEKAAGGHVVDKKEIRALKENFEVL